MDEMTKFAVFDKKTKFTIFDEKWTKFSKLVVHKCLLWYILQWRLNDIITEA